MVRCDSGGVLGHSVVQRCDSEWWMAISAWSEGTLCILTTVLYLFSHFTVSIVAYLNWRHAYQAYTYLTAYKGSSTAYNLIFFFHQRTDTVHFQHRSHIYFPLSFYPCIFELTECTSSIYSTSPHIQGFLYFTAYTLILFFRLRNRICVGLNTYLFLFIPTRTASTSVPVCYVALVASLCGL